MVRLDRLLLLSVLALAPLALEAEAQERYFPLDHRQPTGVAGRWGALTRPGIAGTVQSVRVSLPSQGQVTFFPGSPENAVPTEAPSQVGFHVGHTYRLRISGMPEFPGVELYPTVELLGRLHAPADLANEFPVPIEFTEEEIETALQDRMVTKVVYLEQPDLATPIQQSGGILVQDLPPTTNLLAAADLRGRPLLIVRLGGRIPDRASPAEFYCQSPMLFSSGPAR